MFMNTRAVPLILGLSLGLCGASCGGDGTPSTPSDTTMGSSDVQAGTFQVSLVAPDSALGSAGYTSVVGKVADGPTPAQLIWTQVSTSGACRLMKPRVPFCDTPCTGGAVCVDDNKCQSYPSAKSVGTVKVSGIKTTDGATEFSMDPIVGNYQPSVSCPFPAFAEGAAIELAASGGVYAPFTLKTSGIAPLALLNTQIPLATNQSVKLSWSAPGKTGISSIYVKLDISHHGGTKGMIECDTDDSGALEIPAALVTDLLNLGTAGFPTVIITRNATVGSAVIAPGRVDLKVSSTIEHAVQVAGVVSCNDSSQCATGQTCQADLTCK